MDKKRVIAYFNCIPPRNKNPEKPLILENYIKGVNAVGDEGIESRNSTVVHSDVAVIQGFVHEDSQNVPHLMLRKNVVETQKRYGRRTVVVDSNLFLYKNPSNPGNYLRYSFDGVFPTTGEYCWDTPDPARWQKISRDLNLKVKDWRKSGNHILICLQRNGGWSMKGNDVWQWLESTVKMIRQYSDRPIIVRGHPGDKKSARAILRKQIPPHLLSLTNTYFSDMNAKSLEDDLRNCWATVVFNSSPAVASAIEGVPVFVFDPIDCQAGDVANTNITQIESPDIFDRQSWLEKISMCHWNFEDLKSGACWSHMKKYVKA